MTLIFLASQTCIFINVVQSASHQSIYKDEPSPLNLTCMLEQKLMCLDILSKIKNPFLLRFKCAEVCIARIVEKQWTRDLNEPQNTRLFIVLLSKVKRMLMRKRRRFARSREPMVHHLLIICSESECAFLVYLVWSIWKHVSGIESNRATILPHRILNLYVRMNDLSQHENLKEAKWMDLYFALSRFSLVPLEGGLRVAMPWSIHKAMMRNLLAFGSDEEQFQWIEYEAKCTVNITTLLKDYDVQKLYTRLNRRSVTLPGPSRRCLACIMSHTC